MVLVGLLGLIIWLLFYVTAQTEHDKQDAAVVGVGLLTFYTISLTVLCNMIILPLLEKS